MTDNKILVLGGFPLLKQLKTLMAINNKIRMVEFGLGKSLPNLETLVLTGNEIKQLADIDALSELTKLTFLSLHKNDVTNTQNYRLYTIYKIPKLRYLDFQKIKQSERDAAKALFESAEGEDMLKKIAKHTPELGTSTRREQQFTPAEEELIRVQLNLQPNI